MQADTHLGCRFRHYSCRLTHTIREGWNTFPLVPAQVSDQQMLHPVNPLVFSKQKAVEEAITNTVILPSYAVHDLCATNTPANLQV